MYPANGQLTQIGSYPTIRGSHANFVFPDPDAAFGCLQDSKFNALMHHRTRFPHSNATDEKGVIPADAARVGGADAALAKPPAWLVDTARVIGLVRLAD
jgi:hypothetical protein